MSKKLPHVRKPFPNNNCHVAIIKHMGAGIEKPCLLISRLLNVAKTTVVADLCLKRVYLSSILLHCTTVQQMLMYIHKWTQTPVATIA